MSNRRELPIYEYERNVSTVGNVERRQGEHDLRITKDMMVEYAKAYCKILEAEADIKSQKKNLDVHYKQFAFPTGVAKKAIKLKQTLLKKPHMLDDSLAVIEWLDENPAIISSLKYSCDPDDKLQLGGKRLTEEGYMPNGIEPAVTSWGDLSTMDAADFHKAQLKEYHRYTKEELKWDDLDHEKERLERLMAIDDHEMHKKKLWEVEKSIAKRDGLPEPEKPDYILELENRVLDKNEIFAAEQLVKETRQALDELTTKWEDELIKSGGFFLDLDIDVMDLSKLSLNYNERYKMLPGELKDGDVSVAMDFYMKLIRYYHDWSGKGLEWLNQPLATVIPEGYTTKNDDINKHGTTEENRDAYLRWCKQFDTPAYMGWTDPNMIIDYYSRRSEMEYASWGGFYVGGFPYPEEINCKIENNGLNQSVNNVPFYHKPNYEMEQFVPNGQPWMPRPPIYVGMPGEVHQRKVFEKLLALMDVPLISVDHINIMKQQGEFGEDLYVHLVNEQNKKIEAKIEEMKKDEFLDDMIAVYKINNQNHPKGEEYSFKVQLPNKLVKIFYNYGESEFQYEILNRDDYDLYSNWIGEPIKYLRFAEAELHPQDYRNDSGKRVVPISKEEFEGLLSNTRLWGNWDGFDGYADCENKFRDEINEEIDREWKLLQNNGHGGQLHDHTRYNKLYEKKQWLSNIQIENRPNYPAEDDLFHSVPDLRVAKQKHINDYPHDDGVNDMKYGEVRFKITGQYTFIGAVANFNDGRRAVVDKDKEEVRMEYPDGRVRYIKLEAYEKHKYFCEEPEWLVDNIMTPSEEAKERYAAQEARYIEEWAVELKKEEEWDRAQEEEWAKLEESEGRIF